MSFKTLLYGFCSLGLLCFAGNAAGIDEPAPLAAEAECTQIQDAAATNAPSDEGAPFEMFNLKMKTFGGKQFWTDRIYFHDWRIQQHAYTDHCRLISPDEVRYAWGSMEHCQQELEKIKQEQQLEPLDGTAVIFLHGLGRSRNSLQPLVDYVSANSEFHCINLSYASTRDGLTNHAAALDQVLQNLEDIDEIHFVGHSLGNLVVRHYLHLTTDPQSGELKDKRIRRMVMLGPPNQGAQLAERFGKLTAFKFILGDSAVDLARNWEELNSQLDTPPFEFAIIAGDGGTFTNPLIDGENDLFVSTEEAKLKGAADFRVVNAAHTFIMQSPEVQQMMLNFLKEGYLADPDDMRPLTE
jgi:pimeloyl-ACP methyl ester carboxylesterase